MKIPRAVAPALAAWCVASCAAQADGRSGAPAEHDVQIMSFAEYARTEHEVPYVLRLVACDDHRLVYFGAQHVFDPMNDALKRVEAEFAAAAPAAALIEGGVPPLVDNREEAIRRFGEAGLVRYLAGRSGATVASLDMSNEDEARALARRHAPADTLLFFVVRQLGSYNTSESKPDFDEFFGRFTSRIGRAAGLPNATMVDVAAAYSRAFGAPFRPEAVTSALTDPVQDRYLTQRIARDSNVLRDTHMVDRIVREVMKHERVFAVAGHTHVVMQERALRRRLGAACVRPQPTTEHRAPVH